MQRLSVLTCALSSLAVAGCASDPILATDQCVHTPGCVTTRDAPVYGPPHAVAIAPQGPGTPR